MRSIGTQMTGAQADDESVQWVPPNVFSNITMAHMQEPMPNRHAAAVLLLFWGQCCSSLR